MMRRVLIAVCACLFVAMLYFGGCFGLALMTSGLRQCGTSNAVREYAVDLPAGHGKVALVCRTKPRGVSFEGCFRAIRVEVSNCPAYFVRFPETFSGDRNCVEVGYMPERHMLVLRDVGVREPCCCILDLSTGKLKYIVRNASGRYWGTISSPSKLEDIFCALKVPSLIFPSLEGAVDTSDAVPWIANHQAEALPEWVDDELMTMLGHLGDCKEMGAISVTHEK